MNWQFLASFGIAVGVWLVVVLFVALIKFISNKRKFIKEKENHDDSNVVDDNLDEK